MSKLLRPPGNSVIFKKLVYYIKIIFPREFLSRRREESMELLQRVYNYNILYTYLFMIPKLIFVLYFMLYVSILYTYCVYIILLFIEELNIILWILWYSLNVYLYFRNRTGKLTFKCPFCFYHVSLLLN